MEKGIPNEYLFRKIAEYASGRKTLDIGCGNKAYTDVSNNAVTLDGWNAVNPDYLVNLEDEDLPFNENEFECILMLDFIEHMKRERGEKIIEQAKIITSGRIYLLTPLWWDTNEKHTNNPECWAYGNALNNHLSLWAREDFFDWTELGFTIENEEYYFGYWEK